jgi:hypothetical protein
MDVKTFKQQKLVITFFQFGIVVHVQFKYCLQVL